MSTRLPGDVAPPVVHEGVHATAARREAAEELGLRVRIGRLLAIVTRHGAEQWYYLATFEGGVFGSGNGGELSDASNHPNGAFTPVWLERVELMNRDVRPWAIAAALADQLVLLTERADALAAATARFENWLRSHV